MSAATSAYERLAERLCSETARLNHGYWSGLAPAAGGAAAIYRRRRRLFGDRAIEGLREAADGSGGEGDRRRARQLLAYALEARVLAARLGDDARAAEAESRGVVRSPAGPVPLARIGEALAREQDGHRRRELLRAADAIGCERIDPPLATARDRELAALAGAGYGSRREAIEQVEGIDLTGLAREADKFLRRTGPRYRRLLAERAAAAGLDTGDLDAADLPFLARRTADSELLEPAALRVLYAGAAAGLGLEPTASGRISLDLEGRQGKSGRSFCAPVSVPGDVRVVIACDERGRAHPRTLLHEAGHAQHRAHTDPGLGVPARLLGDASVTESYAFLFETLAPGVEDPFASLLLLRRYCALLIADLETERGWGRESRAAARERFAATMSDAAGVRCTGARLLRAPDPGFYAARYLRGWMLARVWEVDLQARFGEGWARAPEAGHRLRRLWADGQRRDAEQMAREEAGADALGFEVFAADAAGTEAPAAVPQVS